MEDGDGSATTPLEALKQATGLVASLREDRTSCPHDADRFDWSADVLDEIARLVCEIAPAIEHRTNQRNDVLRASADDLATAVVANRNALMCPSTDRPGQDLPGRDRPGQDLPAQDRSGSGRTPAA